MLIGGVGASPASSNSSSTSNINRFALTPSDGPYLGNNPEIATTDNKSTVTQIDPANERTPSFSQALHEKIEPQKPQPGQDKTEPETEDPSSEAVLAKQTMVKANGNNVTLEVEVGNIVKNTLYTVPAQLASTQKPAIAATAPGKENAIKTNDLCQLEAGAETPNKPAKLVALPQAQKQLSVSAQPGLKTVSHDSSSDTLIAEPQSGEGKNVGKIQVSDKTFITTEYLTNQQSGKQLKTEPPGTINKTIGGSAKMPVVGPNLPMREDNASQPQQKISVGQGKSALIADEPVESQANIGQQEPTTISQKVTDGKSTQIPSGLSQPNTKDQADNTPGDSVSQKLNLAWVQMSTSQTKDPGSSTADDGANPDFEQMPSHNSAQTLVTEQSFTSSQVAKTANNASTDDVSPDVSTQLQEHIHSSLRQGDQQITIRLNPPELGKVFIKFQEQDQQIIGLLEVSRTQTRVEIQQLLPQIIQTLQDSGIQVKRLEVLLTNQQEQHTFKDQSLADSQDSWSGQQGSANPGTQGNNPDWTGTNEWLTNADIYAGFTEPQEALVTDNSINMLI